jgi:hypothetical protein
MSKTCEQTRERKPMVHILLKKEKRSRRVRHTIRLPKQFRGVLRFDGHLTGAIYCSKKHGKVHTGACPKTRAGRLTIPQLP